MPGDGGGLAGKGGVLLGVGGSGFSLLYKDAGGEGALPRRQIGGGGGGGAEEECFMPVEGEEAAEEGEEPEGEGEEARLGSEGRWARWAGSVGDKACGEGLSASSWR